MCVGEGQERFRQGFCLQAIIIAIMLITTSSSQVKTSRLKRVCDLSLLSLSEECKVGSIK